MPEIKQFTRDQYSEAFEGSAADLIKQMAATPPATPAVPATPVAPVAPLPPVATPAAVTDPLQPVNTLNPDQDAANLLGQGTDASDEPGEDGTKPDPTKSAPGPKKQAGRPVQKLDNATRDLVSALIKDNKLFGFQDGKLDTRQDLDDLLEANFQHREEARKEEIRNQVFAGMNPALQFIAAYANQVDSPADLIPLIQTTSNAERFGSLDETNPAHQEAIVRERLRLQGDTDDIIEQEITDLKDRNKLADRAKTFKPVVQKFYETQAKQMMQVKQQEEQQYLQQVQQNVQHVRGILDADNLDGLKLKNQHKGLVFELLAMPREEYGGGMGIYHVIDTLFQKGDFNRLAKIALLAGDEKAFEEVIGTKLRLTDADATIRKLNIAGGGNPTVPTPEPEPPAAHTLQRPLRTGFGFSK